MGLRFYIGNSGTGKSYTLYQHVLEEAAANPDRNYIVLVPEQFTMQTQKDFVTMSPSHGILNIDVLSFQRLAFRVLAETGANKLPVLDEIGKTFVVKKVAEEKKQDLMVMSGNLSKLGYINEVKSMISELIQYDVKGETIEKALEDNASSQQIYGKLHDIQILYDGFRRFLKEKFITSEELLDVLYRMLDQSCMFENCTIVMDGFTGFTPLQRKVIGRLMGLCRQMWVTVTYDTTMAVKDVLPDYHLFCMSAGMMRELKMMAAETGMNVEEPVVFPARENYRFKDNPPMASLERNLFRGRYQSYKEDQDAVSIHICRNPLEEMEFVAEEIRRLVMTGEYRYRDIAVVTGDLSQYGEYAQRVFGKYNIPFFSDYKRNALSNPVVACIRNLLECANRDFTYESVSRLWRTGLMPFEQEQLDRLQNYVLAKGVRGRKRWEETWTSPARNMDEEQLEELNLLREQFVTPMLSFVKCIRSRKTTIGEKTVELYRLMEHYHIQEQLEGYRQMFEEQHEMALAKEYSQMYRVVVELLERLVDLLGEEAVDGQQYAKFIEAGFAETKVGIVPPGVDEVLVGDIERSRLKDIKALFFLGVNDGIIPKSKSDAGILSEMERETVKSQGMELSPGREEQYYTQKYYLYLNLTKPREKLYITYSKVDAQGDARNPSYLIGMIGSLFDNLNIIDEELNRNTFDNITAPVAGMNYIMEHLSGEKPEEFYGLYKWFEQKPEYAGKLEALRKATRDGRSEDKIHGALAKALYTDELSGSVTRLERYAACAYSHFLQYGIGTKERQESGFRMVDFGVILHEALDLYSKELGRRNLLWTEVSYEEQKKLMDQCVDQAVMKNDATVLYYTARDKYRITRMKRVANRTVWALTKQLAQGSFIPSRYELQFRDTREIRNGLNEAAKLNLRGKIDRMDVYEDGDNVYVKVMDYKTGKAGFKLVNIYHGTSLQLIVYLRAAMKFEQDIYKNKNIVPAGIVYYKIDDPIIEKNGNDQVDHEVLKQLMVDGVISEEEVVLKAMDKDCVPFVGGYESSVIPFKITAKGGFAKRNKTVSQEEFQVMLDYSEKKVKDMSEMILSGDIRVNPYEDGMRNSCSYCAYKSVCVQEKNGNPIEYRDLGKLDETTAYAYMKMELEKEKEKQDNVKQLTLGEEELPWQ